ncbi:MAG: hypothetical protein D6674_01490 [Acidobacteria bacterium]|jgi:hypothetical protein|nr:MAG: hypothetical protein D6674_01490 [Acidobacteriota bacterium]
MSVRHQVRSYVERLFEKLKEPAGEYTIYNIYSPVYVQRENLPVNQIDIEEFEIVDIKVDFTNQESIKNFLDKTTRETLEREVKGFYLLALLLDKDGEYILSSENPMAEELREGLVRLIESLKEE